MRTFVRTFVRACPHIGLMLSNILCIHVVVGTNADYYAALNLWFEFVYDFISGNNYLKSSLTSFVVK